MLNNLFLFFPLPPATSVILNPILCHHDLQIMLLNGFFVFFCFFFSISAKWCHLNCKEPILRFGTEQSSQLLGTNLISVPC